MDAHLQHGDCRRILPSLDAGSARLAYLDPPFFTQRVQRLAPRDRQTQYEFSDLWSGHEEYAEFLEECLQGLRRVLASDGSLFFHCDRRAAHIARALLDRVFGPSQFRSEIIWHYRRWSNARRALLPAHQTLYLYTKSNEYVFNPMYGEYSPATNVDQLLQRRVRDDRGKAVYERDDSGNVVTAVSKKGVPLSDVWDIPYLNPKARERVGYPTQKPVLLLERIIRLASEPGDLVIDPCCGSGTTLVAASLLGRRSLGIDVSRAALRVARERARRPSRSESPLLERGRESYRSADPAALGVLRGIDLVPVHRNRGIDAILREPYRERPVAVRVQRAGESALEAAQLLARAGASKQCRLMILIVIEPADRDAADAWPEHVLAIESPAAQLARALGSGPSRTDGFCLS